jgi:hypothetical protein
MASSPSSPKPEKAARSRDQVQWEIPSTLEFVAPPSSGLTCPMCRKTFHDPVILSACGHSFCRDCIEEAVETDKSCPLCRSRVQPENVRANLALLQLIQELEVYCTNRMFGCQESFKLELLPQHLEKCSKKPVKCPQEKHGCEFAGEQGTLETHLEQCPYEKLKGFINMYENRLSMLEQRLKDVEHKNVAPSRPVNKTIAALQFDQDDESIGVVDDVSSRMRD